MSQNFSTIAQYPFQGVAARTPVQTPNGWRLNVNARDAPGLVPVNIDWNLYWQLAGNPANVGVNINLQAASVQATILDRILAVKIDNLGSPTPVYVYFPDTGDTVACSANESVIMPVFTNNLNAVIFAIGLTAGNIPKTRIFFLNFAPPPNLDPEIANAVALWKASPSITRGNQILNTNFGTPALGDQTIQKNLLLSAVANQSINLLPVMASGFYYFTNLIIKGYVSSSAQACDAIVESTGAAGILFDIPFGSTSPSVGVQVDIADIQPMQIKVDATQQWRFRIPQTFVSGSFCACILNYTFNPT